MTGRLLVIVSVLAMAGAVWDGSAHAQNTNGSKSDLNGLIQRFEQVDRQSKDEGFVLEKYQVEEVPGDPIPNSMNLSIGGFGPKPATPFEDRPKYSIDPTAPPEPRPFGFNLKMKF